MNKDIFTRFTSFISKLMGRPTSFIFALVVLLMWSCSGPLLGFSDTWQLIINTGTTIITFLMVFIIQNTQNRDNIAINIKLDVLMQKAGIDSSKLLGAEDLSDRELEKRKKKILNGS
jgi:low affinity Fe/Cu permease